MRLATFRSAVPDLIRDLSWHRYAAGALFFLAVPATSQAQEMRPLEEIQLGNPEKTYRLVRCAGFYLANLEWAGQALSQDVFDQSKDSIASLLLVATLGRAAGDNDDGSALAETVNLDTRQIADLYLYNYRKNYALVGTAWENNPLWESGAATCKPITEAANVLASEMQGDKP